MLAGSLLVAACGGDADGAALSGVVRTPPLDVSEVTLPDESPGRDGEPFAMRADENGLLLTYFGYTSCPDICPTTLSDIGVALEDLGLDRASVDVAMVTFDPERDTGEVISSYLDHFVEGGHALRTEDPEALAVAEQAFRVRADKVGEGEAYDFEHTAVTYVVDDTGTVILEWPFGTTPEAMRSDLEILLEEQRS